MARVRESVILRLQIGNEWVTGLVPTSRSGSARLGTVEELQTTMLHPGMLELATVDFSQQGMMIGALRQQAGRLTGAPLPVPQPMTNLPMMNAAPGLAAGADPLR